MGRKSKQKHNCRVLQGRVSSEQPDVPWTPLEPTVGQEGFHTMTDGEFEFTVFTNSRYTVLKRSFKVMGEGMIHLSIKRNDKKPVRSWRDLQKIKNELVGSECEGVQIFPAESRLLDSFNQTHLWVCADPEARLPFGYNERLVSEGNLNKSVQEPFENHVRPEDLTDIEVIESASRELSSRYQPVTKLLLE